MSRLSTVALLLLAAQLCLPPVAHAAETHRAPDFARVDLASDGKPRALQVAIVTYQSAEAASELSVDLIAAVHIADAAYYQALNERFRDYDVLLYEMVISDPARSGGDAQRSKGLLTSLQLEMKDALGLSFQLDEINYRAPNFVHADFSGDMLRQSMAERGESLYVYFWRIFYSAIDDYAQDPLGIKGMQLMSLLVSESDENAMKIAFAYEMVKAARIGDILGSDQGSAVVAARNEHAIKVLQEQVAAGARKVGIFYGAAHMVDFDKRLVEQLDLTATDKAWLDVWQLASDAPPSSATDR